jgi:GDSL-like Lipase/Acylhydrolase family
VVLVQPAQDGYFEMQKVIVSLLILAASLAAQTVQNGSRIEFGSINFFGTDTGSANAYTVANSTPPITAYVGGMTASFIASHANTGGPVTLQIGSLSAVTVKKQQAGTDLIVNDIASGGTITVQYNATSSVWEMQTVPITIGTPVPALDTTNLISAYLLQEGTGTTYNDSSGNARTASNSTTGVSGTAAAWVTGGLRIENGSYISIPAAGCSGALTIEVWYNRDLGSSAATTATGPFNGLVSSDSRQWIQLESSYWGAPVYSNFTTDLIIPIDKVLGPSFLALVGTGGSPAGFYINSIPATGYKANTTMTAWTVTTSCDVGNLANPPSGANSFSGTIYAVMFRSAARTQAQLKADDLYVRSVKQNSVAWGTALNYGGPVGIFEGDSITKNQGGSYMLGNSWEYVANQALGSNFTGYNFGLSGETLATMLGETATINSMLLNYNSPNSFVSLWGGTNDIATGASAATVYANMQSFCAAVIGGATCIPGTTLPRGDFTGPQDTIRQTLNTSIVSGWLASTIAITVNSIADFAGDPVMGNTLSNTNSGYYNYPTDQIHPNAAGNAILGQIAALAIHTATGQGEAPFWLKKTIPSYILNAAATTQTLNLLQLGPKQKLCGVTQRVITAFTGGAISAITSSVGNSGGSTTSYTPTAYSFFTVLAPQDVPPQALNLSDQGIVQETFTATGANLSVLTAGKAEVSLCVVSQP